MISSATALTLLAVLWRTCLLAGTTVLQWYFHLGAFVRALLSVCDDFPSVSYMACYLLRRVYKSFFFFLTWSIQTKLYKVLLLHLLASDLPSLLYFSP